MAKPIINIIGAGKLGQTIGYLIAQNKLANIGAVLNLTKKSTLKAIDFIGQGQYCSEIKALPHADITLIATPDDHIASVCAELSQSNQLQAGDIIFHCSGVLSSDCLISVKQQGCYIASIHPMHSFAIPHLSINAYPGTYCAMEGDSIALDALETLFAGFGSITYLIQKNQKSAYHAGGVFASNYLITLAEQAVHCIEIAGVNNKTALNAVISLMESTLKNLKQTQSPQKALTGPIQRGDISTLQKHLDLLKNSEQASLYALLGKSTLEITALELAIKQKINKLLECFI